MIVNSLKTFLIILVTISLSCSNQKEEKIFNTNNNEGKLIQSNLSYNSINNKFVFSKLKRFEYLDTINLGQLNKLEGNIRSFIQDTTNLRELTQIYYFSNEGKWKDFERYTFIIDEVGCCTNCFYNIYRNGKIIESFKVASLSANDGMTREESSYFINDTTIIKKTKNCEYFEDRNKPNFECDSIIDTYILTNSGKIIEKE